MTLSYAYEDLYILSEIKYKKLADNGRRDLAGDQAGLTVYAA
jgi:hypothetical protein